MSNTVVTLDMTFEVASGKFEFTEKTTVKSEMRTEVLESFIRSQIGAGEDDRKPVDREVYHITIHLDLADDSFRVQHDCGNMALVTGIVMEIFGQL